MLGLDSWGRQRRLHGDQRSLAQTVNTVRSELSLANLNPLQTVILQEHSADKNDHFQQEEQKEEKNNFSYSREGFKKYYHAGFDITTRSNSMNLKNT